MGGGGAPLTLHTLCINIQINLANNTCRYIHQGGGAYMILDTKGKAQGVQIHINTDNEVYNRFKLC